MHGATTRPRRRGTGVRAVLAAVFLFVAALAPVVLLSRPDPPDQAAAPAPAPSASSPPSSAPSSAPPSRSPSPTPSVTGPPVTGPAAATIKPVGPLPASDPLPPRTAYQEFVSICGVTGRDAGGVVLGGTACLNPADRSTYRVPALLSGGRPLDPHRGEVYYKSAVRDYPTVRPFPSGLRFRTPDLAAVRAADRFASWDCGEASEALPASCPAGNDLLLKIQSPSCWDGRRLDSSDHAAHLTWPLLDRCPGSHPVALPMVEVKIVYKLPPSPLSLRLATGDGGTARVDYVARWQPAAQAKLVDNCLHRGRRCDDSGTDPGNP